jgi:hypothetical protein
LFASSEIDQINEDEAVAQHSSNGANRNQILIAQRKKSAKKLQEIKYNYFSRSSETQILYRKKTIKSLLNILNLRCLQERFIVVKKKYPFLSFLHISILFKHRIMLFAF